MQGVFSWESRWLDRRLDCAWCYADEQADKAQEVPRDQTWPATFQSALGTLESQGLLKKNGMIYVRQKRGRMFSLPGLCL